MTLFVSPLEYGMAKKQKPKEMKLVLLNKSGMLREQLKKAAKGKEGRDKRLIPNLQCMQDIGSKVGAKLVDVSERCPRPD